MQFCLVCEMRLMVLYCNLKHNYFYYSCLETISKLAVSQVASCDVPWITQSGHEIFWRIICSKAEYFGFRLVKMFVVEASLKQKLYLFIYSCGHRQEEDHKVNQELII